LRPPTIIYANRLSSAASQVVAAARTRRGRRALTIVSSILAVGLTVLAVRHFASSWPPPHGHPGLLAAAAGLFLAASILKAYGWRRLFRAHEAPKPLALAAANGGASVLGLALPGRFDDVVRIAIVRRSPGCRACVRSLGLSLFMLGLVDAAALAPLAVAANVSAESSVGIRAGLALVAGAGVAAAAVIVALPRLTSSARATRFRLGRWVAQRTTTFRSAWEAWALVSASWLVRSAAIFILFGALGLGFSIPLALLFLCAGAAAAALPVGPAGAAAHAGAGAAVLAASGIHTSEAIGVAVTASTLGIACAFATLLAGAAWAASVRLAPQFSRHA
jgi:hypothetical protein